MLRFETGDPTYYMIISFSDEEIQAGTYTFGTGHDAECTGNVTIKGNPYNFINGEMTVSVENDIYTLRFDDISASTGSSRPITVSLNFTGNIME